MIFFFIFRAPQVHGNKYNYDKIAPHYISNGKSRILILCNTCKYEWIPTISDHVTGKYCVSCAGNLKWYYERFITKTKEINRNKRN